MRSSRPSSCWPLPSMPAGERARAVEVLDEALALAEPGGFIRIFVDEGAPMARLLYEALSRGVHPDYVRHLLAAFPAIWTGAGCPLEGGGRRDRSGRTPQLAGARGSRPHRRWADQSADRSQAVRLPAHGEVARPQHLRQARCEQPHAGNRQGTSLGTPARGSSPRRLSRTPRPGVDRPDGPPDRPRPPSRTPANSPPESLLGGMTLIPSRGHAACADQRQGLSRTGRPEPGVSETHQGEQP